MDLTELDVDVNGVTLHVLRGGHGTPLLFAHGISDSAACWLPIASQLAADGYELVAYDARGHGRSSKPERDYAIATLAEDLAGLVAALGLERPVLIGHSMGAETSFTAAALHPGLARALVLEDPPWREDPAFDHGAQLAEIAAWIRATHTRTLAELIAAERASSPRWSDAELQPWAEAKHQAVPQVAERYAAHAGTYKALLGRVTCPTLLITGDPAAGAIVSAVAAARAIAVLPNGQVAHIPRAGHSIRRDQPEAFVSAVREFLAEVL
jgi:N-formylmaleamate deformylase